jgi:hypothetical protein
VIRGPSSPGAAGLLPYALDYALHPNPEWGTFRHLGPAGWRSVLVNHGWSLVALHRGGGAAVAALVGLATLAATLWHVRQVRAGGAWRAARLFLLLWLGTDLAFFLWWLPGHRPFYVLTALPTLLLFLLALDDVARARPGSRASAALPGILAAVVAGVATLHLAVVILPLHRTRRPAHDEARMLDERVPPECRLLVSYEVAQSLRYYHDRRLAAHVRFPLLCLYQGKPVPPGYGVAEGECAVLELAYLRPDQNLSGFDGYAHPAGWLAGLDWLLDLERGPDGEVVSCRDFDLWRGPGGTAYLSIAPLRRPVAGLREILARLDDLAAERAGWTDRPFGRWLEGRP